MISLAVSVPEQKNGGLSHQPICKLFGMTISTSSIEGVGVVEATHNRSSMLRYSPLPFSKTHLLYQVWRKGKVLLDCSFWP